MADSEPLHAAINDVLIGCNHLAGHAVSRDWPHFAVPAYDALEALGAGLEFDAWCAWSNIMRHADVLRAAMAEQGQNMADKAHDRLALALFEFLCRRYVQRADARQSGLQYTTAETHDLARELARFIERDRSGRGWQPIATHWQPGPTPADTGR